MKLKKYQKEAAKLKDYKSGNWQYPGFALPEEAGEVAQVLKFSSEGQLDLAKLKEELGDVLFRLTQVADEHGLKMADIAKSSLKKREQDEVTQQ